MARFFIDRPVFAWVLAIITMMAGVLAITSLPIEQYPKVAPPSVTISASYPGASAETVENSVTQVIEQSLTGIDNLRYFSASSSNSSLSISVSPHRTMAMPSGPVTQFWGTEISAGSASDYEPDQDGTSARRRRAPPSRARLRPSAIRRPRRPRS